MSHYEARLSRDLERIRHKIAAVFQEIDRQLERANRALLTFDRGLAYETILGDLPINRDIRNLDRLCHRFIAVHLPSAGHLRYISSVLRLNIALERIGDYGVTICREVVQLDHALVQGIVRREIERLANNAFQVFRQATEAFDTGNAELARATMLQARQTARGFDATFEDLVEERPNLDLTPKAFFSLLMILHRLLRVSDQSKNICEETVFATTGETKEPKVYRVLFLDGTNGIWSQMARSIAQKAYPESGKYASAGLHPAPALDAEFVRRMDERGYDLQQAQARGIDWPREEWDKYHVIVSLEGPISRYLTEVPFHSVALEWPLPEATDMDDDDARFEARFRTIAGKIRDLMETLRGEDAS